MNKHGPAYTLLKTLAFPPAEWILTPEQTFQCDAAKVGKSAGALFFVLPRSFLFRVCKHESPKKAWCSHLWLPNVDICKNMQICQISDIARKVSPTSEIMSD
jgi:hypothetical protein